MKTCGGCRHMFYCSKDCQKKDWKIHKLECKIYKAHYEKSVIRLEEENHDYFRLLLRVYLTLEQFPDLRTQSFKVPETDPPQYRCYDDLRICEKEIKSDEDRALLFLNILFTFGLFGIDCDTKKISEHFCKIMMNKFHLDNFDLQIIGLSIFVLESGFKHSCIPNASLVFNGINLKVRALKNISSGEKITINYFSEMIPQKNRRELLQKQYYFTCSCPKCLDYKEESKFCYRLF